MPLCPMCEAMVDVDEDEVEEGEVVSCPECSADLEVISIHPLELNPLDDEDEEEEEEEESDELLSMDEDEEEEEEDEE